MKKILLVSIIFSVSAMMFFPGSIQADDLIERKLKECKEHLSDASQWEACMNKGIAERAEKKAQEYVDSLSEENLKKLEKSGRSKEKTKEFLKKLLIQAWEDTIKDLSKKH